MNHVIILAAGQGQRMKSRKDKLLLPAGGNPLIYYSLMSFNDHPDIDDITVVANKINKKEIEKIIKTYGFTKIKNIAIGGLTRQGSLAKGLETIKADKKDIILVHNAANPLPSHQEISECIHLAEEHDACIVGHFAVATVKEVNDRHIIKTHDREKIFLAETPQAIKYNLLKKALINAEKTNLEAGDEAMLLEAIGQEVRYIEAHEENFKITTQGDYLKLRTMLGDLPEDFRMGIGQDSHMFEEKEKGLTIAGIELKDELKLQADSDGDVVLHAIFNALSQAMGDMSLGFYADEINKKGIKDSKKYLEPLLKKIKKEKFKINSVGIMIECKTPKIDPLVKDMKKSLSKILDLDARRIGITATSGEELTLFGAGLGIQCFAIASLIKR